MPHGSASAAICYEQAVPSQTCRYFREEAQMMLNDLISTLKKYPADLAVPVGFGEPYLYHGYFGWLAFSLKRDTTVGEMLAQAESAVGKTYIDCAGVECSVSIYNDCWFDDSGEQIGPLLLSFMTGDFSQSLPCLTRSHAL